LQLVLVRQHEAINRAEIEYPEPGGSFFYRHRS
jgi:hypothetical protein